MGFLKFLKREKREDLDELDLPPPPPSFGGAKPELPDMDFDEKLPELPEFPELDEKISAEGLPEFEFPEEKMPPVGKDMAMPEFPSFPEEEMHAPQIQPAAPEFPEPEQPHEEEVPMQQPIPRVAGRLFSREKSTQKEMPNTRTIYVKVDNFKAALGSINIVRSDLRNAEEALAKLENIKGAKDRSYDRLKSSLDDLQKKLIFIDKTLFKGE